MQRRLLSSTVAVAMLTFTSLGAQSSIGTWTGPSGTVVAANMNDNTATVIDASNGRTLATLPTGNGPHEVAATHDGHYAVVSNYGPRGKPGQTLTVIDLTNRTVTKTIDLGAVNSRPHGMKFLPGDSVLVVTSQGSSSLLMLSFPEGRVFRGIPTHGRGSHMVATSASGADAFVTNVPDGSLSHLTPFAGDSARVIHVAKFIEGLAVSPDGKTVWTGTNNEHIAIVVDAERGQAVDTIAGFGIPYRLAWTPDGATVLVTDPQRAEVKIFDARSHKPRFTISIPAGNVVATAEVPGSASPEGVIVTPDSKWAFVTLQGRNQLVVVDLARGVITGYTATGTWSDGIAFAPPSH